LIDRGILQVTHCVSEQIIADFFTKPLQGRRFEILRDVILNVHSSAVHRSMLANSQGAYALQKNTQDEPNELAREET